MAHGPAAVVVGTHEVTLLRNGRETFPAMLAAIERARWSIAIEMYWIGDDPVGWQFRAALVAAATRGVDVRVIVDAFGSAALPSGWFDRLIAAGGRTRRFRPLLASFDPRTPRSVLARDHRKLLIIDASEVFVGGLNLCVKWSPIGGGGEDWRDTAVHVRGGELAQHVARLFEASWARVTHGRLPPPPPLAWSADGGRIGVLANSPERRQQRKIRQAYLWGLRRARSRIDITCAYFAPRRVFVHALLAALRRGVRVRLLLPLESDVWIAGVLAASWIRVLAGAGIQIYGYAGAVLHAKTAVVDGRWVTVGSHNLDALSWAYNLECNVFADDEALGRAAERTFEDDLLLSVRLPASGPSPGEVLSRALGHAMGWLYDLRP